MIIWLLGHSLVVILWSDSGSHMLCPKTADKTHVSSASWLVSYICGQVYLSLCLLTGYCELASVLCWVALSILSSGLCNPTVSGAGWCSREKTHGYCITWCLDGVVLPSCLCLVLCVFSAPCYSPCCRRFKSGVSNWFNRVIQAS